ncbi:CaiB/BaiF CoA transferase family protein [Variovorax saccharolyticus]|uniref:CaiB/BaiF CoA transferase family protein n=1 Tax=Variovorax saccharolyticus TaxID=3053516 RepID=UPI002576D558|nr:CoA transferase [Variovorax sp. J22R187]MDM0021854.1 CoA transferase [Variovorax sp. J22R187]
MLREALRGIRVLDFSQIAAGPICTMLLADMGAEVIKVESPQGDLGRSLGPAWVGRDSALFHAFNRNKKGVCLDLKKPESVQAILAMAGQVDVVVESFRPGVMERLGLGYETVRALNSRLIYCAISAYGQTGPYAQRAGVDGILQADSGLMSIVGLPDAEPCKVQTPVVDVMTGNLACMGIVAKLLQRGADGPGGLLDVSLLSSAISLQLPSLASYLRDGVLPERLGSAAPYSAPNEAFRTTDGWVMVAAYMGDRWPRLCELLGCEHLAQDPRFIDSAARTRHRAAMRAELGPAFEAQSTEHWLALLQAHDILCAKVSTYLDLMVHPQVESNRSFINVETPEGTLRMPGFPINPHTENSDRKDHCAPGIGEHTEEVLRAFGISLEKVS